MNVTVRLDPQVLWKLTEKANRRGMTLKEFAADVLEQQLPKAQKRQAAARATEERIRVLHGEGFTDAEMAAQVDRVQEHVARLRRSMGLKANRKRKEAA